METIILGYDEISIKKLFHQNVTIKDFKKLIKSKTGIKKKNQRFQVFLEENLFDGDKFWELLKIQVYDITNYEAKLKRDIYERDVILDLNKSVNQLKQMVFEQTKVPIERQIFYLDDFELPDYEILKDKNLFKQQLFIKITKESNDLISIKRPNSEINEIYTDLYNTGFELLQEIAFDSVHMEEEFNAEYNLIYQNKIIPLDYLLINLKSNESNQNSLFEQNELLIELKKRENTYKIYLSPIATKKITFYVEPTDTIELFKSFIRLKRINLEYMSLTFHGQILLEYKKFEEYNIKKEETLSLSLRLRGGGKKNY